MSHPVRIGFKNFQICARLSTAGLPIDGGRTIMGRKIKNESVFGAKPRFAWA